MKKLLLLSAIAWGISTRINAQTNTFPASGNVGIGTTNPGAKLEVNGGAIFGSSTSGSAIIINDIPGARYAINTGDYNLAFKQHNAVTGLYEQRLTLANGGNVYIKTDVDGVLTFDNTDNSWQYMQFRGNGVRKTWMGIDPDNNFNIYKETGGAILFGGSNVGIGTTNPGSYKLAVEGTIGARKVKVTTASWADYVFEKNYHLPSLAEVEKYIQQHKHLPDVPSAAEVEKNGLDLGDNQAVLLKKIEELILYVIDQHKRQADQDKKIEQQNKKIEILEVENKAFKILQNEVEKIKIERDGFIKNKSN